MMWYVGCPLLLSVDIIKVMRLVGEGGTSHGSLEPPYYYMGCLVLTGIFSKFVQFSRLELKSEGFIKSK